MNCLSLAFVAMPFFKGEGHAKKRENFFGIIHSLACVVDRIGQETVQFSS